MSQRRTFSKNDIKMKHGHQREKLRSTTLKQDTEKRLNSFSKVLISKSKVVKRSELLAELEPARALSV